MTVANQSEDCLLEEKAAYRLVGETNTETQQHTSNVEHGQIPGTSINGSTNSEPETSNNHTPLAAKAGIQQVRCQTSNSTCMGTWGVRQVVVDILSGLQALRL